MEITNEACLRLWQRAARQEFGIAIKTNDKRGWTTKLYEVRKASGGFDNIVICNPGRFPDELWLVKRSVRMEE